MHIQTFIQEYFPFFLGGLILGMGSFSWIPRALSTYSQYSEKEFKPNQNHDVITFFVSILIAILTQGMLPLYAFPLSCILAISMIGIARVDFYYKLIPDRFQIGGLLAAVGLCFLKAPQYNLTHYWALGIAVPAMLFLLNQFYKWTRSIEPLGFGDLKLLFWMGLLLGPQNFTAITIALFSACLIMGSLILAKKWNPKQPFPFGPFIVLGLFATLQLESLPLGVFFA